jgi:SAM-dependent methyltransferase
MTRDEILELLDRPIASAAAGAALELGLFWQLAAAPRDAQAIAEALGVPFGRCLAWLRVLADEGLIESTEAGYRPTEAARAAILDTHSAESWAMLAQEARERIGAISDLPVRLGARRSASAASSSTDTGYVGLMSRDPQRARRFTRMLYEIHAPLAEKVAARLDLSGVERLLDLGGGSGVIAIALARRWPGLSVQILDIANVCAVGGELVESAGLGRRIGFTPADFVNEDLPAGFDAILECDVGIYSEALFRRIHGALPAHGRFILIDELAGEGAPDPGRDAWSLIRTLEDPDWAPPTIAGTLDVLKRSGFRSVRESRLEPGPGVGGREAGPVVLEAAP